MAGWEILANYMLENVTFWELDTQYCDSVGPDCYCDVCGARERPLFQVNCRNDGFSGCVIVCGKHKACVNNHPLLAKESVD
jgi:hypothetical protein